MAESLGLSEKPFDLKYLRWKHRKKRFKVTVTAIVTHRGPLGYYTQVFLEVDKTKASMCWPAIRLKTDFAPIRSSKFDRKTKYQTLQEDPFT